MTPLPEPLTKDTALLSIDVESNGLHGAAFAVGAVLIKADGKILDEFMARCPIEGDVDKWVKDNVLKPMKGFEQTHGDSRSMRDDFWQWYKVAKAKSDYVLVDNGYPVEARFLLNCQDDDLDERYWDHPFPLLDLSSMLLQVGLKPLSVRYQFVTDELNGDEILQHNPRFDAYVSALAAIKVFKMSGQLKVK